MRVSIERRWAASRASTSASSRLMAVGSSASGIVSRHHEFTTPSASRRGAGSNRNRDKSRTASRAPGEPSMPRTISRTASGTRLTTSTEHSRWRAAIRTTPAARAGEVAPRAVPSRTTSSAPQRSADRSNCSLASPSMRSTVASGQRGRSRSRAASHARRDLAAISSSKSRRRADEANDTGRDRGTGTMHRGEGSSGPNRSSQATGASEPAKASTQRSVRTAQSRHPGRHCNRSARAMLT